MIWPIFIVLSLVVVGWILGWIAIPVVSLQCKHCGRQISWSAFLLRIGRELPKVILLPNFVPADWCPCGKNAERHKGYLDKQLENPRTRTWLRDIFIAAMLILVVGLVKA